MNEQRKRVLVTGGSGFIGSHLADELRQNGFDIIVYDLKKPKYTKIKTIIGNVTNKEKVEKVTKNCDFVIHLAGLLGTHELVDNAIEATNVNILGTLNVLEACKNNKTKLIEISKPNCWVNTYTITKIAAESFTEMYRCEHGIQAVTVKWFNVYGSRQPLMEEAGYKKLIPTAIVNALNNKDIEIYGNGKQTMDLIHTIDTTKAMLAIIDNWKACEGHVFEIGSGKEISVNEAVKMIIRLTNSKSKIIHIPMRKGETDETKIKANIKTIQDKTMWSPKVSLEDGLKQTIKWYAKHYSIK